MDGIVEHDSSGCNASQVANCVIVVGSGSSTGTPRASCLFKNPIACGVCKDAVIPGSKNRRRNPSLYITYNGHGILFDCGKSFREAFMAVMLGHQVSRIDSIVITHGHADAILGLDDAREWTEDKVVPVYARDIDMAVIKQTFPYLANRENATGSGYVAKLQMRVFDEKKPFEASGLRITPYVVIHGKNSTSCAFRFGKLLYISDISEMPPDVRVQMIADGEIDILIIDGLRPHEHNLSHLSIDEAVVQARLLKPRKTYIIGMSHESDYHKTNAKLRKLKDAQVDPIDVELCFDGLKFPLPE